MCVCVNVHAYTCVYVYNIYNVRCALKWNDIPTTLIYEATEGIIQK